MSILTKNLGTYYNPLQHHFSKYHPNTTLKEYYNKMVKTDDIDKRQKGPVVAVKRERTESNVSDLSSGYAGC